MKKRLLAIILLLAFSLAFFSACGIIVKNTDRDYAQIVAEVGYNSGDPDYVLRQKDINGEYVEGKKLITKRELVVAFMNNGYNYVQNGMTVKEAVQYILNQLIRNEIVVQEAIRVLAKAAGISGIPKIEDLFPNEADGSKNKELIELEETVYDSEFEQINTYYNEIRKDKGLDVEDSDEDKEPDHDHKHEDTTRTTQTKVGTTEEPYEKKYDKAKEPVDDDNWKAAIKKYNDALNDSEKGLDREKYYKRMLNGQMEQKIYEKYQKLIEGDALNEWLDKEDINYIKDSSKAQAYVDKVLQKRYETDRNAQIEKYSNNPSAFISAINSEELTDVLYIPQQVADNIANGTEPYFYTQNLLIKYTDTLQRKVDDINAKNISDALKKQQKAEVLKELYAEDLRAIFEVKEQTVYEESGKIVRREVPSVVDFAKEFSYMPFTGKLVPKTGFDAETYYDSKFEEYLLEDAKQDNDAYVKTLVHDGSFLTVFKNELNALISNAAFTSSDNEYFNKSKTAAENAFMTLIFKYGNDTGMFNNDKGYIVKPTTNGTASSYVVEYQIASVAAFAAFMSSNGSLQEKQLASITATPSDFGYHIIMCSGILEEKKIESNAAQILIDFKNKPEDKILGYEKTFAYTLNETIQKEIKDTAFATAQTKIIQIYEAKSGYVTKYESRYQDLLNLK